MAPKPNRRSGGRGVVSMVAWAVLIGLGIVALGAVALPSALLLVAGMLPTASAWLIDPHERHRLTKTVGFLNFAGTVPFLVMLWTNSRGHAAVWPTFASPTTWLVIYGAAGFGWLVHLGMPVIVAVILQANFDRRERKLRAQQDELRAEWGPAVGGAAETERPVAMMKPLAMGVRSPAADAGSMPPA